MTNSKYLGSEKVTYLVLVSEGSRHGGRAKCKELARHFGQSPLVHTTDCIGFVFGSEEVERRYYAEDR